MDNLTHTLLGGALAAAGLRRRTALATSTLLIAANLPDLDALSYAVSSDHALGFRRGWTHGVLALAVLPALLAGVMMLWQRIRRGRPPDGSPHLRRGQLVLLSYLGCWTHPFLDWLNTYGIRLLIPFDQRWFYGDTLFIIDPWLWLVLGGALFLGHSRSGRSLGRWGALGAVTTLGVMAVAPSGARAGWLAGIALLIALRASGAVGRGDRPQTRRRLARGALIAAALYVGILSGGSPLAEREIRGELAARGVGPLEDLMVGPLVASPLRRDVIAVTAEGYRFGVYDWLTRPRFELLDGGRLRPAPTPVVEAAMAADCVRGMVGWLRYPFVEVDERDDGWEVHLLDVRYVRERRSGFGSDRVRLDRDLAVVELED